MNIQEERHKKKTEALTKINEIGDVEEQKPLSESERLARQGRKYVVTKENKKIERD